MSYKKIVLFKFIVITVIAITGFISMLLLSNAVYLLTCHQWILKQGENIVKTIFMLFVVTSYITGWIFARLYIVNIDTIIAGMGDNQKKVLISILEDTLKKEEKK